jgi:hypothetical protein
MLDVLFWLGSLAIAFSFGWFVASVWGMAGDASGVID